MLDLKRVLLMWLAIPAVCGAQSVEFPVWSKTFPGLVAGKKVEVNLDRRGPLISGYYCYAPCAAQKRYALRLSGTIDGNAINLEERDESRNGAPLTGYWALARNGDVLTGNWSDAARSRQSEVALKEQVAANDPGLEIHLVADALPDREQQARCGEPPTVSAIKLYKDGQLLQTLETVSQGTCDMFLPEWQDVNFDGIPDLILAQFLPAGPNIPYQTWINDGQRFVDAPPDFQEITSPDFDAQHQRITSFWRGSCCSHGVNVYRWNGDDVELVEEGSSYTQPVLIEGVAYGCYVVPGYRQGHVIWPLQERNGKLTPFPLDKEVCDELIDIMGVQTVIQRADDPLVVRTETPGWQKTDSADGPRWCPEVPFLDGDKITRKVLNQPADLEKFCQTENPQGGS
ncbi:XAC2610-related protein [Entomohabitans teleogrylli]|uniref:XAC2610-related protein n=1 Tax=Entomohabitans teleogrylli TaxID=1384589 RepID=UPI00073D42C7|nr:hypothetical protein [Entomohabitans teleogrylli]